MPRIRSHQAARTPGRGCGYGYGYMGMGMGVWVWVGRGYGCGYGYGLEYGHGYGYGHGHGHGYGGMGMDMVMDITKRPELVWAHGRHYSPGQRHEHQSRKRHATYNYTVQARARTF